MDIYINTYCNHNYPTDKKRICDQKNIFDLRHFIKKYLLYIQIYFLFSIICQFSVFFSLAITVVHSSSIFSLVILYDQAIFITLYQFFSILSTLHVMRAWLKVLIFNCSFQSQIFSLVTCLSSFLFIRQYSESYRTAYLVIIS